VVKGYNKSYAQLALKIYSPCRTRTINTCYNKLIALLVVGSFPLVPTIFFLSIWKIKNKRKKNRMEKTIIKWVLLTGVLRAIVKEH
jgi:L-cystine uptake protein TcyP (sodium:dicarboxylate symporter family)